MITDGMACFFVFIVQELQRSACARYRFALSRIGIADWFSTVEFAFARPVLQAMEAIQNIQMEVRVAQYIREEFVPHAVSWFTGEMQDEEEDDEDYEDDEEDEDEEEDEEEEEPAPRRGGKGGKAGKKPAADEDEDEEEEEEEEAPKGKGGKKGGKGKKGNDEETAAALAAAFQAKLNTGGDGSGGAAGNPPECKQQ